MKRILVLISPLLIGSLSLLAQEWEVSNAPSMGDNRYDDIYFINDSTGWAVNGGGEIYFTKNYGISWKLQWTFAPSRYIRSIEFIDDRNGFIGTLQGEVYRTTDAGENWQQVSMPETLPGVCGISHYGESITMVGVWSSPAYVIHSNDGGNTWSYQDMSDLATSLIDCWHVNKDTVFVSGRKAGHQGVILRSDDAGITWREVTPLGMIDGLVWKLHFASNLVAYASLEEGGLGSTHFLKSTDGGDSFQLLEALSFNINIQGIGFISISEGWIGGWSSGMYHTTNGGQTWENVSLGKNVNRFFFLKNDLMYSAGSGIYRYGNPLIITELSTNYNQDIHKLEIFPNPTTSTEINVKMIIGIPTMVILELYDLTGRHITRLYKNLLEKGERMQKLDLGSTPPGVYLITMLTNEHAVKKKIILMK